MSQSPFSQLWDFQSSFFQPHTTTPGLPDAARRELRKNLLVEEYEEYLDGENTNDLVAIADALIDMTYIIYGTGVEYGLPMDELFNEVHRSNMSKLDFETGKPIYREDGKIMKPPTYSKPDLVSIIERAKVNPPSPPVVEIEGENTPESEEDVFEPQLYTESYIERFVVSINTQSSFKAVKADVLKQAKARNDKALYIFVPTLGDTTITRL